MDYREVDAAIIMPPVDNFKFSALTDTFFAMDYDTYIHVMDYFSHVRSPMEEVLGAPTDGPEEED